MTVLPSGYAALDQALHRGGWPRAALTELLCTGWGIGEMQLLSPLLARCSTGPRQLFFLGAPHLPYAPALHACGIRLESVLLVQPTRDHDLLWCAEQILRSGTAACLLAWLPETRLADYTALRRLQLVAQRGDSTAFLFRPARVAHTPSPAVLRLMLSTAGEQLAIEILRQRGGRSGQRIGIPRDATLLYRHLDPELLPVGELQHAISDGMALPHH